MLPFAIPDMPRISSIFQRFMNKERGILIVYFVVICIVALERIVVPHVYGKLLAAIKKMGRVYKLFAILVVLFCIFQALETWLTLMDARLLPAFESFVRENVVDEVITRHRIQYAELDLGDLTSKLIKLPAYMRDVFYRTKSFLLFHLLSAITTGIYLFYCHWWLGAVFATVLAVLVLGSRSFVRHCREASYAREAAFDHTQESIQDLLSNLLAVYNSQNEAGEQRRVQQLNDGLMRRIRESVYCGVPYRVLFAVCFLILFTGITGLGIYLYHAGRLELDLLVSSFIVTFAMLKTCMSIYHDMESFIWLRGGMQVVEDFLERLPTKPAECGGSPGSGPVRLVKLPPPLAGSAGGIAISFNGVSFWHSSKALPPALDRFSLRIPAGQRVVVRGGVGSGKSTMSHLLVQLQCQQEGAILVGGVDTREVDLASLRRAVHYVGQHPRLFNRTLWENLTYGNQTLTSPDQIYDLLRSLRLPDVERAFRQAMHKPVGKQGSQLSGGQRQIAWILRGVLTPSSAIVLDEPTSSLDENARSQVMRVITGLIGRRTAILITHDPELMRVASRVITLEAGRVVSDEAR